LHGSSSLNDYVDVTGIAYAKFNGGYFLLDTAGDHLAVYTTAANYNAVAIGDQVRIKGLYKNYYTLFQISNLTFQEVISHDNVFTITPTVLVDALDLKDIDAAADRVMHGTVYTITVTVKVLGSGYVDIYAGAERVGTVYSYSLTDSLNALKAQADKVVTIDVIFYTLHPTNGVMVLFQGGAEDIELAVLTGQDAVDADAAALAVPATAVGGQSFTLAKLGAYGSAVAWSITTGSEYATLNVANDKVTFANVEAIQTVELTATLTLAGVVDPTTRAFTITVNPITTSTIAQVRAMTVSAQLVQVEGIVYFFTNNSYYITDGTGNLNIYTTPVAGMALGDRVVIVGTLAAYNGQIQIINAVVKQTVSTGNVHAQTPEVYVPGTSVLVSGNTYTVTGTVAILGTNNNVYIMDGETILMAIYYRSTVNDSYNALKAQVGKQVTFDGVYMYNGNDSNLSPAVPGQIFFVYQEGADGLTLPELTDAEKLAADVANLTITATTISGASLVLPATGGYGSAIVWSVVSGGATILTDTVTFPNVTVDTDVVLQASLTIGTETAVTKDFTVTVQALTATTVLEARNATIGNTVYFQGIVTALVGNNAFIQDGTAGIYVYVGSNIAYQAILVVGNEVKVLGKTKVYSQLLEVDPVTSITLVAEAQAIPAAVNIPALILADIVAQQGKIVSIDASLTIAVKPALVTNSSYTMNVTDGVTTLQIRIDKSVAEFEAIKTFLNALEAGQAIAFINVPVGQYNATPQLMLSRVDQIVVPQPGDIVVTAENFNTNKDDLYWGVSVGFALSGADVGTIASVSVSLYDALGNLLVTNVSKEASKVNTAKAYSSAFIVVPGTYSTSSTWEFGVWTPNGIVVPAKAVITVTDLDGMEYTVENNTFMNTEPVHPAWQSLFPVSDIVVTAENFNTNQDDLYWGISVGFALSGADVAKVGSVKVELFDSLGNLLVTNTSKEPSKVNTAKSYSSAFRVVIGTYTTSSTWNLGAWEPSAVVVPAKAVITVTDVNGYEYAAENLVLSQGAPSWPTWESLFPILDIVVTAENFNTNLAAEYNGVSVGFALSGADVASVMEVRVALYDGAGNLLVENVSKEPSKVNIAKSYSSAFIIVAGTYSTSSTWEFGAWTPSQVVMPAKAVITAFDANGFEYSAENLVFNQGAPSWPTWISLFPLDLFFSEYIEGSSYNKAIEVYNPTNATVDLTAYTIELYSNGAAVASASLVLAGTLPAGQVYVLANGQANAAILAQADYTQVYSATPPLCVPNWNGDDAIVLKHNGVILDVFGQIGFDPGSSWNVGGVQTADRSLVRKSSITGGDIVGSDVFNPSVEWVSYAVDTTSNLGWHLQDAATILLDSFDYADEATFELAWTNRVSGSNALDPSELLQVDTTAHTMVMTLPAVCNEGWWLARKYSTLASYNVTNDYNYIWMYVTNNTNTTSLFSIWLYWTGSQNGYTVTLPATGTSGWIYFQISNTGYNASQIIDFGWGFNNFSANQVTGNLVVHEVRVANHIPA
ncbi:MAG: lamin tail domain-containing protein, partial [Bacillota bacterium]|nr:lamin tail domain-containing protein [Bacillota bacterium]